LDRLDFADIARAKITSNDVEYAFLWHLQPAGRSRFTAIKESETASHLNFETTGKKKRQECPNEPEKILKHTLLSYYVTIFSILIWGESAHSICGVVTVVSMIKC
jgi:hypothetical protein